MARSFDLPTLYDKTGTGGLTTSYTVGSTFHPGLAESFDMSMRMVKAGAATDVVLDIQVCDVDSATDTDWTSVAYSVLDASAAPATEQSFTFTDTTKIALACTGCRGALFARARVKLSGAAANAADRIVLTGQARLP